MHSAEKDVALSAALDAYIEAERPPLCPRCGGWDGPTLPFCTDGERWLHHNTCKRYTFTFDVCEACSACLIPPEESVPEMLARVAAEEEAHAGDTDRPHYRNRVTPTAEGCTCGRDTYDGPGKQWLSHAPNCRVLPPGEGN